MKMGVCSFNWWRIWGDKFENIFTVLWQACYPTFEMNADRPVAKEHKPWLISVICHKLVLHHVGSRTRRLPWMNIVNPTMWRDMVKKRGLCQKGQTISGNRTRIWARTSVSKEHEIQIGRWVVTTLLPDILVKLLLSLQYQGFFYGYGKSSM